MTVEGNRTIDGISLRLENRTDELTETDLPHLFEPFWRKDTARSDRHHHGLGLALAAEFAALLEESRCAIRRERYGGIHALVAKREKLLELVQIVPWKKNTSADWR